MLSCLVWIDVLIFPFFLLVFHTSLDGSQTRPALVQGWTGVRVWRRHSGFREHTLPPFPLPLS